jgi:hypothetical protein
MKEKALGTKYAKLACAGGHRPRGLSYAEPAQKGQLCWAAATELVFFFGYNSKKKLGPNHFYKIKMKNL